jgi:hypothetical protein
VVAEVVVAAVPDAEAVVASVAVATAAGGTKFGYVARAPSPARISDLG